MANLIKTSKYGVISKTLPTKGDMAWEYNPILNYRLNSTCWKIEHEDGKIRWIYDPKDLVAQGYADWVKGTTTAEWTWKNPYDENGNLKWEYTEYEKYQIIDFDTDLLDYDSSHPVDILPLYSYDGSVNLILNDGNSIPRLINTRFSTTGQNTYEIIDRQGDNDTNIYDEGEQFDIDTSLLKITDNIPTINFKGVVLGGNLKVGNYFFYFKLCDADGNETNIVGLSHLVSVFIGSESPKASETGNRDLNSNKLVSFTLTDIDTAYNYLIVYYSRTSAADTENSVTSYLRINKKFIVNKLGKSNVIITGYETTTEITSKELNTEYYSIDAAKTQASSVNRLFLGNVHKTTIPYTELEDLALRFLPKLTEVTWNPNISKTYSISGTNKGYYSANNIYHSVGYWPGEYYRFGIVFIMKNGDLSPVFNVRGALNIDTKTIFLDIEFKNNEERTYIKYNEESFLLENNNVLNSTEATSAFENSKGVVSYTVDDEFRTVLGINFEADKQTLNQVYKYCKGFFFVRLKRIPNIVALGVVIGTESTSGIPMIPTRYGVVLKAIKGLGNYHHASVSTDDDIYYVTEGFLTRYKFYFKKKPTSWLKSLLGAILIGAGLVTIGSALIISNTVDAITLANLVKAYRSIATINGWSISTPSGYDHVELDNSRILGGSFVDRLIMKVGSSCYANAIVCPDYTVNLPYFNSIFTGNEHMIKEASSNNNLGYFRNDGDRHFYITVNDLKSGKYDSNTYYSKIVGIADNVKLAGIDKIRIRTQAGLAETAYKYVAVGEEYKAGEEGKKRNSDIVRGSFSSMLLSTEDLGAATIVNIYKSGYSEYDYSNLLLIRSSDNSTYHAISDRIRITDAIAAIEKEKASWDVFSGDSYICQYTQRINRNFNDPSALYNDEIVDGNCWKNNYDPDNTENLNKINAGDVNAVELGMWLTFPVRSPYNLCIRSVDHSQVDEKSMTGHGRGYYPKFPMSTDGNYKTPESEVYNRGFATSVGELVYFNKPDVPYIKNWFGTRIMYSNISVTDSFRNGFRVFKPTAFRDYTREYGSITKIISLNESLFCVLEHGIFILPLKANAQDGGSYLTTDNVLPELPTIISGDYGSQWKDSILKTENGIYGVDTSAKKIWRYTSRGLELLSENKVLEFLNLNLILTELLKEPIIGRVNVKTVYNAFKSDVMFTFYNISNSKNGVPKDDEVAWNLCFSEKLNTFITFYSWIPSFMENIDNIPFSFDRTTSKYMTLCNQKYNYITLSNPVFDKKRITTPNQIITGHTESGPIYTKIEGYYDEEKDVVLLNESPITDANGVITAWTGNYEIGVVAITDKLEVGDSVNYSIAKDREGNYKYFELIEFGNLKSIRGRVSKTERILRIKEGMELSDDHVYGIYIEATTGYATYLLPIYICTREYFDNLSVLFWKHGLSGIIDVIGENTGTVNSVLPTRWYGKLHPFEIEFVVNDLPSLHKIFDNLEIVSNMAEPESFHYEVVGDLYDFAYDKKNMYIRQEATKRLYYDNGADISYNTKYEKMSEKHFKMCDMLGREINGIYKKSTIFPLYYSRKDALNDTVDYYQIKDGKDEGKNYSALSGAELVYYQTLDEYRIWNHGLAVDISNLSNGRLRGNMQYKESTWQVQINPIQYWESNESAWKNDKVPIVLNLDAIPLQVIDTVLLKQNGKITVNDNRAVIQWSDKKVRRQEAKPKDKWMKVRIRYTGDKLAVISAIRTMYSISMS